MEFEAEHLIKIANGKPQSIVINVQARFKTKNSTGVKQKVIAKVTFQASEWEGF